MSDQAKMALIRALNQRDASEHEIEVALNTYAAALRNANECNLEGLLSNIGFLGQLLGRPPRRDPDKITNIDIIEESAVRSPPERATPRSRVFEYMVPEVFLALENKCKCQFSRRIEPGRERYTSKRPWESEEDYRQRKK